MTKSSRSIFFIAALLLALATVPAVVKANPDTTPKAVSVTRVLFADGLDGAGWLWNTANTLHNLTTGPWDLSTPIGGYCYKCGGFYRGGSPKPKAGG